MKYSRFEDLPCWQKARELCQGVFKIINRAPFSKDFGLKDQLWVLGCWNPLTKNAWPMSLNRWVMQWRVNCCCP